MFLSKASRQARLLLSRQADRSAGQWHLFFSSETSSSVLPLLPMLDLSNSRNTSSKNSRFLSLEIVNGVGEFPVDSADDDDGGGVVGLVLPSCFRSSKSRLIWSGSSSHCFKSASLLKGSFSL